MSPTLIGSLGMPLLMGFILVGVPVPLALMSVGVLGIYLVTGSAEAAFSYLRTAPFESAASYAMTTVPLFVLMGNLAFAAGIAKSGFDVAKKWLGHIPGGLAMAVVVANAAFGAICGVVAAAAAIFTKLAIPEMEKSKISRSMASGLVAAGATFSIMIPPSFFMIVYAIMANVPMGPQLMAGWLPGLLCAALYAIYLYIMARIRPDIGGIISTAVPWRERIKALPSMWALFVVAVVITGGIYLGIFTPTEAAAVSCLVTFILFISARGIGHKYPEFRSALLDTGRVCGMCFLSICGAIAFSSMMAISQVTYNVCNWLTTLQLNPYIIILILVAIYFILGIFIDGVSLLFLTLPVVLPIVQAYGFDLIWFGVLMIKMIQVAMITPPLSATIYVVKATAPYISLGEISRGCMPFFYIEIVVTGLIIAFPQISLFIPNLMMR